MHVPQIDISFSGGIEAQQDVTAAWVKAAIRSAVDYTKPALSENAELSVHVCGDDEIQTLNAQWRDKDKPTNVLSFPGDETLMGDIIISIDTMKREAELENKTLHDHFTHLTIHGFLHLLGYDHETETDAVEMESLETKILAAMDIADPYS